MSKATKRKHVTKEVLEDYYIPENGEEIVKIIGGRGNNLHEVERSNGDLFLVSMPTKFRRNVWVKRGDFVIVDPIKEGNKVQGEIVYILYTKQIKYLKDEDLWPKGFLDGAVVVETKTDSKVLKPLASLDDSVGNNCLTDSEDASSDNDDDLFQNPNHRQVYTYDDDTSSDSDSSDGDDVTGDENDKEDEKLNINIKKLNLNENEKI